MDFQLSPDITAFREEVRAFIAEMVTSEVRERISRGGTSFDWVVHRKMAERGWLKDDWPLEYGGAERDPFRIVALQEELELCGGPSFGLFYARALANCIRAAGSPAQKADLIPKLLGGEIIICLGYSEPSCGSDVAATRTRAVRDGDHWVINGQKMWTTMAEQASHVFLLTRTNTEVPKHRGLTMFVVSIDTPGIEIHEVKTLGGERTNITYYSDVRVPDSARVGDVDGGWTVMINALRDERPGGGRGLNDRMLLNAVETLAARDDDRLADPAVLERLGRIAVENEVARLIGYSAVARFSKHEPDVIAGPMFKLFSSEIMLRNAGILLDLLGPKTLLHEGMETGDGTGLIEEAWRHSHVGTIYAGTSEVQRDIIAQRGLNLPRQR
jgi:alkylation response protein AidB-like acyl-CoA dehydrogenase